MSLTLQHLFLAVASFPLSLWDHITPQFSFDSAYAFDIIEPHLKHFHLSLDHSLMVLILLHWLRLLSFLCSFVSSQMPPVSNSDLLCSLNSTFLGGLIKSHGLKNHLCTNEFYICISSFILS